MKSEFQIDQPSRGNPVDHKNISYQNCSFKNDLYYYLKSEFVYLSCVP